MLNFDESVNFFFEDEDEDEDEDDDDEGQEWDGCPCDACNGMQIEEQDDDVE